MARPASHVPPVELAPPPDDTDDLIWSDVPWPIAAAVESSATGVQVERIVRVMTPDEPRGDGPAPLHLVQVPPTDQRV